LASDSSTEDFTSDGNYVLDDGAGIIYGGSEFVSANVTKTFNRDDSPGWTLGNPPVHSDQNGTDDFATYLMFKPESADSIWVTLRKLTWSWSCAAEAVDTGIGVYWFKATGSGSSSASSQVDVVTLPEWDSAFSDLRWE